MTDLTALLETTLPFSEFTPERQAELAGLAQRREYPAESFVTLTGERWPYLAVIETGSFLAVKESAEGRALTVLTLERGDVFWGLTFFEEELLMPVSLKVASTGALVSWSRQVLLPFLKEEGEALWALCRQLVGRMQQASAIVEDLAFQPVAGRLAKLLLKQYPEASAEPVPRDMTLDEMAARVGTTREMVCRILYRFADDQLIHISRTEFTLKDKGRLSRLAGAASDPGGP